MAVLGAAYYFIGGDSEVPPSVAATESTETAEQPNNEPETQAATAPDSERSAPMTANRPPVRNTPSPGGTQPRTNPGAASKPTLARSALPASYQAAIASDVDISYVNSLGSGFLRKDKTWYRLYEPRPKSPLLQQMEDRIKENAVGRKIELTKVAKPTTKIPVQVNLIRADSRTIDLYCPTSQTLFSITSSGDIKRKQFLIPTITKRFKQISASGATVMSGNRTGNFEWSSDVDSVSWINDLPQAWPTFNPEAEPDNMKELIAQAEQSVVRVDIVTTEGAGNGSGFLIDGSGLIATNYHVIEDAIEVAIFYKNGERLPAVGFVHLDAKRDLAIIRAHVPKGYFPGLPLAQTSPEKGEEVVAFGAPLGLSFSATQGIVSALRDGKDFDREGTWVQTTAAISPGNS